jgi:hypothetical protein
MTRSFRLAALALIGAVANPLPAQELSDQLSLHGYFSQAYARSGELPILGMTKEGTTDYRTAALQLRYNMTSSDNFVVQVQHRRLGDQVVMQMTDDVELDWAFYERKLPRSTSLRIGKLPIPSGIYNEVRDVGVLLPFHQSANFVYADGIETIDGVLLSHTIGAGRAFSLDVTAFAGEWDFIETEYGVQGERAAVSRNKNTLGGRLWLHTPIDGLEVGIGGSRSDATGGLYRPAGVTTRDDAWIASINGDFTRFDLRGEYLSARVDDDAAQYIGYYGQGGVQLTEKLQLNAQLQIARLSFEVPGFAWDEELGRDFALGLKYSPLPNLALKLEGHRARGYIWSQPANFMAPGPKGSYLISGISVGF